VIEKALTKFPSCDDCPWCQWACADICPFYKYKKGFAARLEALIQKHEDWFNQNPHDEYFGYNHGMLDAYEKVLEAFK